MKMKPKLSELKSIYKFYKLIHHSQFSIAKKRTLMTAALGYECWSWRVVGITHNAVMAIASNNYKHPKKTLSRDHRKPRAKTYERLFSGSLFPFEKWRKLVWEKDTTVLMTNEEHQSGVVSKIYRVDYRRGLFQCSRVAGWKHSLAVEGEFVKNLVLKHKIKLRKSVIE